MVMGFPSPARGAWSDLGKDEYEHHLHSALACPPTRLLGRNPSTGPLAILIAGKEERHSGKQRYKQQGIALQGNNTSGHSEIMVLNLSFTLESVPTSLYSLGYY